MSELQPPLTVTTAFRSLANSQVSSCCRLADHHAKMRMRFFSKGWAKEIPKPLHASLFKHVVLFAFRRNFPGETIAEVCKGAVRLFPISNDDFANLMSEIERGNFNQNRVDQILSEHYGIPDLLFDDAVTAKGEGLEAFLVGM